MTTNEQIGQRIEARRVELDLTMQEVADKMGVDKSTVQRYEKGKIKRIKLPVIESFASALCVNPNWIIGKSDCKLLAPAERAAENMSVKPIAKSAPSLSKEEAELLRKFNALDDRGRAAVLNVLNHEYESLPGEKAYSPAKEA